MYTTTTKSRRPSVWPLPSLNGRDPVVVECYSETRGALDLAYARLDEDDLRMTYRPGSANGTGAHFMPNLMPAFAVQEGSIAFASKNSIILDHGNGWATHYANLEHVFARPTRDRAPRRAERVKAGDVLGYVGAPLPGQFKRLQFALWRLDDDCHYAPLDPMPKLRDWLVLPWTDNSKTPTEVALPKAA